MRLVTYELEGKTSVGVRRDGGVVPSPYDDMIGTIAADEESSDE